MATTGQIHWHEGLFLRPHHMQVMQKHIFDQFSFERRLCRPFSYGVIEARVSDDELENMRVSFDCLKVIMPSGIEVSVPNNTDLSSLDIKEAFAGTTGPLRISLGVPLWYGSRPNVIEADSSADWRTKRTYLVKEIEHMDENTGDNPQPILVRRINARLLLDHDDHSDMEVLPILSVVHSVGEDVSFPRRDPNYVPSCMVISGSVVLRELVRDLISQVIASRQELVVQVNRGGFSLDNLRGVQFEQILRLRTLNRFAARLSSLVQIMESLTPFEVYLDFKQLLAELAALRPDRDQFDIAEYDHDNPIIVFRELGKRIRALLKGTVQAKFLKVVFSMDEQERVLIANLDERALSLPNEYFLAIKTKQDPGKVAELVLDHDKFKLMPRSLINQRVFGIKLTQEKFPPVELPAQIGLHYFRLNRGESARMWERIKQEKIMALKWPGIESTDFEAVLYMTVPASEE